MTQPTSARPLPPAPGFLTSSFRVFDLSIGEMLWSRRTIFMALVVGAPVFIALLLRVLVGLGAPILEDARSGGTTVRMTGPSIFGLMIWVFYLRFTVPILGVFYGTSLMADEIEDKTITYLFTRPIRRGAVLLGKYLAYLVCTSLVVLPSVMLVYFLLVRPAEIARTFGQLLSDLGLLGLGLAVYGAVFAFVGTFFKRPLIIGLVFAFGWEQVVMALPGYLKRFSVAYYLQALVPHAMPSEGVVSILQGLFRDTPTIGVALAWLAAYVVVFLYLATTVVERKEYVLEQ
jgi:ABC-2 type transport system permease protein